MRRRLHPFTSVVVPALLVLSSGVFAVKAQAETQSKISAQNGLAWEPCPDQRGQPSHLECSMLSVPVDYSNLDAGRFDMAVVRERARNPQARIGSLVVNNGGPGRSPISFLRDVAESPDVFSDVIRDRFDLVAFDPRGVVRSHVVTCEEKMPPFAGPLGTRPMAAGQASFDAVPTADERAAILDRAQRVAVACSSHENPEFVKNLTTNNVASDMEQLRQALGDEQLNFLGIGYGTYLGATYAAKFSDRVRTFVLDAPVDPQRYAREPIALNVEQTEATNQALVSLLDSCLSAAQGCRFGGGQPVEAFDALLEKLTEHQIDVFYQEEKIAFTADSLRQAVVSAVTLPPDRWPAVLNALSSLEAGDPVALLSLVEEQSPDNFSKSAGLITQCNDQAYPHDQTEWDTVMQRRFQAAPQLAHLTMFANVECSYLTYATDPFTGPFVTTADTPVLVIGGTKDPQAPYAWAQAMTVQLGNARLLTFDGVGHVSYQPNHSCIRDHVDAYLIDGTLPAPDSTCSQPQSAVPLD
jgi:pimeloyl-ACP methyl ester carboxylesterase